MVISFLDWFERHKMGVIGTLTIHTLVLFLFSLWNLRTTPTEEERSDMRIDVVTEAEAEEMVQRINEQENGIPEKVTNLTSNITAEATRDQCQAEHRPGWSTDGRRGQSQECS